MSEKISCNWTALSDRGVHGMTAADGSYIRLTNLNSAIAVILAHALTLQLDMTEGSYRIYSSYSLERAQAEADMRMAAGQRVIFGETRPAGANFAVSVTSDGSDTYSLSADVRNDFEDRPELGGRRFLQLGFVAIVESLDPAFFLS